ncbi:MAG: hypothetical protein SP4CHLAM17_14660 [Chlamydiales bacterium]|nr:hypothetical protein [Chlamydiales bacterium]
MAALSFNRIRLQYYASQGLKRAIWLQYLLQKPYRLFGSVMLGVNIALQIGSQSAREFYSSVHLDPDLAPLTQIFLVIIFAELTPLFAARRCSEHVIMLGTPIVYFTYRIFSPIIWTLNLIIHLFYRLLGKPKEAFELNLSREELQRTLEAGQQESDDFNLVVANIFSLRSKRAVEAMTKLDHVELFCSNSTVGELRYKYRSSTQPYFPLYHNSITNIVAIVFPTDLTSLPDEKSVREVAHSPWFITQGCRLTEILQQFRSNHQELAIVLGPKGSAVGILSLNTILRTIFGEVKQEQKNRNLIPLPLIQRTFAGNKKISDFNKEYGMRLPSNGVETLAQLMITKLGTAPECGDSLQFDQLELTAEETGLLGIKSVIIKSLNTG